MELIYIVVGGSVGVILIAMGLDVARDSIYGLFEDLKSKKIRAKIEAQALDTLVAACRLKNITIDKHRHHGTHRRIPVS